MINWNKLACDLAMAVRGQRSYPAKDIEVVVTEAVLAELQPVQAEIERLRSMIDQTADGALVPECPSLYCPRCGDVVYWDHVICSCYDCAELNFTDGLPMGYRFDQCFSTPGAAKAARDNNG